MKSNAHKKHKQDQVSLIKKKHLKIHKNAISKFTKIIHSSTSTCSTHYFVLRILHQITETAFKEKPQLSFCFSFLLLFHFILEYSTTIFGLPFFPLIAFVLLNLESVILYVFTYS